MPSLGQIFKKYTGKLRSLKLVYVINNLLNRDKLRHNRPLYEKYGVKRSVYQPIDSEAFVNPSNGIPWLDQEDALQKVRQHPDFQTFDTAIQGQIIHFIENGYMVLKGFYTNEAIAKLDAEVNRLLQDKTTDFNYTGKKVMDAYKISSVIDQLYFRNTELIRLLDFVMGKKVIPFQTINFIEGSEQRAHSDSIHMTTEPKGYLIATWTALEKCHEGNGPLFYYPQSHRFPYIMTDDYDSGKSKWRIGNNSNKRYEDKIAELIQKWGLNKAFFHGDAGDVFVWHANLLHGGSPITQKGATRKSMVSHYYCEDVICYHEISQRPALIKK